MASILGYWFVDQTCRKWDLSSFKWYRLSCISIMVVLFLRAAAACNFPTALQNSNYTSSNFGRLEFQVNTLDYAEDGVTSWTCYLNSGNKYVIQSKQTLLAFGLQAHYYYCLSLTQWTNYSYSYYLLTTLDNTKRRKILPNNLTVTLNDICDGTLDAAEFNVMVNSAAPDSAKSFCASPLLGDFQYTFKDELTGDEKCGLLPGDGMLNVCTNERTLLGFNYTACSENVGYSTGGVLYCIAFTSSTSGSTTTYYQSLYNADTSATTQFTCMAVSSGIDANGTTRVFVSQTEDFCVAGQSPTAAPDTTGDTLVLTASVSCLLQSSRRPANFKWRKTTETRLSCTDGYLSITTDLPQASRKTSSHKDVYPLRGSSAQR